MKYDRLFTRFGQLCLPLQLYSIYTFVYYLSELGFRVLQDIIYVVLQAKFTKLSLNRTRGCTPSDLQQWLGLAQVWEEHMGRVEGSFLMLC